jgi:hypothetical protein
MDEHELIMIRENALNNAIREVNFNREFWIEKISKQRRQHDE